jgi:hypothetical protein
VRPFQDESNFLFNYFKEMNLESTKEEKNPQQKNPPEKKISTPKKIEKDYKNLPKKIIPSQTNQPFKTVISETKNEESDEEEPQMPTQQKKTLSKFNRN